MKKIIFFWRELTSTFWFVPVLIIITAIALAMLFLNIDSQFTPSMEGLSKFFFIGGADSARSVLSIISGAMIGVAGTVFSITLVALTLASSQLGPRLIKNFMFVRLNQVVLGSYISTYLYCLIILNTITQNDDYDYIPSLSILFALVAALFNIILLIVFIHRIAMSIQADNIISDISNSLTESVKVLFPEKMGDDSDEEDKWDIKKEKLFYKTNVTLSSPKNGYLQYIDGELLMDIMSKSNYLVELYFRPGAHLVEGEEFCMLYSDEEVKEDTKKKIKSQFIIGNTRNSQQDMEFSIHQMVEIASRALSPGVNDPYTAIACIDNLSSTMSQLAQVKFPSKFRLDDDGKLRVIANPMEFEGLLDAAFNQIRQFSAGSRDVILRLSESLITINKFVKRAAHKKAIMKHAKMVQNVAKESITEENDLNELIRKTNQILKL